VASSPEKKNAPEETAVQCPPSKNGQLAKQGSLTILRRTSSKSLSGRESRLSSQADEDVLDQVDLGHDSLPPVDNPEACEKAALRLRCLLRRLTQGEVQAATLQQNLQYAADVLETCYVDDSR
ncbi:unnamed protein product, partial [Meganyctiphanes norvegica]